MDHAQQPIDEYTLAAFLSGTLPEDRRREVVAYLAANADARELLCLAQEAMEAAREPVVEPFEVPTAAPPRAASPPPRALPRPERPARRLQRLRRVATAALMVVVLGIGLHLGLRLNQDTLRGGEPDQVTELTVRVAKRALQFQWNQIPDAYYYRLVVWDPLEADVVAQHETRSTRLGRDDAFVLSLHSKLLPSRPYKVRVDAMDVQNRLIQSSPLVEFSLNE